MTDVFRAVTLEAIPFKVLDVEFSLFPEGRRWEFICIRNVFASFFFGGNSKKIIDLWKNEKIVFCLSKDVLDEYNVVLQESV